MKKKWLPRVIAAVVFTVSIVMGACASATRPYSDPPSSGNVVSDDSEDWDE